MRSGCDQLKSARHVLPPDWCAEPIAPGSLDTPSSMPATSPQCLGPNTPATAHGNMVTVTAQVRATSCVVGARLLRECTPGQFALPQLQWVKAATCWCFLWDGEMH